MPPPLDFPEHGTPESEVLAEVAARLGKDPYTVERNFGVSYVGPPSLHRRTDTPPCRRELFRRVGA